MSKYKVLWVEDIFDKNFDRLAYQNGLELVHFTTSKEGMNSLKQDFKKNTQLYDAVILDGLAYNNSEDEEHSIDGLINSLNTIQDLKQKKWLPVYIFTGELNKMEYKGDVKWVENYDVPIRIKGVDNKRFIDELIKDIENQEITQLKIKYPNAFAICSDNYLGKKELTRVLQIVKDIENPESIINQQDALVPMRKILEAIFQKLNNIGFIPDEIQNGNGAINGASIFLAGSNKDYQYKEELIHPVIAEAIRHLISLTQDASHNEGTKLKADTYLSKSLNTFLYQSLCFLMIEVLEYLKPFIDNNGNKSTNEAKWDEVKVNTSTSNTLTGEVSRIADNGWGTFKEAGNTQEISIPPAMVTTNNLTLNQSIEVTTEPSPCNTKTFIKQIKIIS